MPYIGEEGCQKIGRALNLLDNKCSIQYQAGGVLLPKLLAFLRVLYQRSPRLSEYNFIFTCQDGGWTGESTYSNKFSCPGDVENANEDLTPNSRLA
jgi:hypothetical protein